MRYLRWPKAHALHSVPMYASTKDDYVEIDEEYRKKLIKMICNLDEHTEEQTMGTIQVGGTPYTISAHITPSTGQGSLSTVDKITQSTTGTDGTRRTRILSVLTPLVVHYDGGRLWGTPHRIFAYHDSTGIERQLPSTLTKTILQHLTSKMQDKIGEHHTLLLAFPLSDERLTLSFTSTSPGDGQFTNFQLNGRKLGTLTALTVDAGYVVEE